ncbi:hypothetical protein BT69DRAFT_1338478 [Atractiella rhizophila]|nr:hypothetical protein BT69DRAFT_1338478 [Atractiella rhizophila]
MNLTPVILSAFAFLVHQATAGPLITRTNSTELPSIVTIGLAWDDHHIAEQGYDFFFFKAGIEDQQAKLTAAGFDHTDIFTYADDADYWLGVLSDTLKGRIADKNPIGAPFHSVPFRQTLMGHWTDCVIIGYGVRGNPLLTTYLEGLVDTARHSSPLSDIRFNTDVGDSTIIAAQERCEIIQMPWSHGNQA